MAVEILRSIFQQLKLLISRVLIRDKGRAGTFVLGATKDEKTMGDLKWSLSLTRPTQRSTRELARSHLDSTPKFQINFNDDGDDLVVLVSEIVANDNGDGTPTNDIEK